MGSTLRCKMSADKIAAQDQISLFSETENLQLLAAKGNIDLEAQENRVELTAESGISITSVNGGIQITAQESITLSCGQTFLYIADGSIQFGAPHDIFFDTMTVQKKKPKSSTMGCTPPVPKVHRYDQRIQLTDTLTGVPLSNQPYRLDCHGEYFLGTTNQEGMTQTIGRGQKISQVIAQVIGLSIQEK